eukprot:jgi/Chlat1/2238/Chrsp17S02558
MSRSGDSTCALASPAPSSTPGSAGLTRTASGRLRRKSGSLQGTIDLARLVNDLRKRLDDAGVLKPEHDDAILKRFLAARSFDLDKAEVMFVNMVNRRKEFGTDTILQARRTSQSSKSVTLEELQLHFHLPINEVARKLGLCVTVLKQRCRDNGIERWPYRKVRKLDKLITELQTSHEVPGMGKSPEDAKMKLDTVRETRNFLLSNPNSTAHLKLGKVKSPSSRSVKSTSSQPDHQSSHSGCSTPTSGVEDGNFALSAHSPDETSKVFPATPRPMYAGISNATSEQAIKALGTLPVPSPTRFSTSGPLSAFRPPHQANTLQSAITLRTPPCSASPAVVPMEWKAEPEYIEELPAVASLPAPMPPMPFFVPAMMPQHWLAAFGPMAMQTMPGLAHHMAAMAHSMSVMSQYQGMFAAPYSPGLKVLARLPPGHMTLQGAHKRWARSDLLRRRLAIRCVLLCACGVDDPALAAVEENGKQLKALDLSFYYRQELSPNNAGLWDLAYSCRPGL